MPATTAQPLPPRLKGNFVLLRAGIVQLLLPQADVGAAEYLAAPPRPSTQPGLFELDGQAESDGNDEAEAPSPESGPPTRLAAALSADLLPLARFPTDRFVLTSFPAQPGLVLCWDEVKVLIGVELQPHPIPVALLPPDAPLREFVQFGDGLAFCCTGERLLAHAFAPRS
jgi:hypothetical protein